MLEKLTIRGFKSIESLVDFPLFPVNVLIGANGAGKSNLIEFFKMLRAMMGLRIAEFGDYKPSLARFLENKGGLSAFLFGGLQRTKKILAEAWFNHGKNAYRFSLLPTADGGHRIGKEEFFYGGFCPSMGWWDEAGENESVLPQKCQDAKKDNAQTRFAYIYEAISSWQIYQFHDTSQFAGVRQPSLVSATDGFHFDGSNLAAFLLALNTGRLPGLPPEDCEESYGNIVETIRLAAPYFDDFVLDPYLEGNDEKVKLQWRQKDMLASFQPHHVSDGTLRFICLATALLQPRPPQLIIIDEPELGLHPEALAVLAELIRSCSARTQFILATQSPTFADCFQPEDIVTVQRRDGSSVFERQSAERLGPWLETYSLGQLWQKNVIRGGVCHD